MEETQQQELDKEEGFKEEIEGIFSRCSLDNLYLIKEVLEKEIRLSETAVKEGFENRNDNNESPYGHD